MKLSMGQTSPVLALSYSSDGFYMAGASYDQVKIWNAERRGPPVAQWDGQGTAWHGASLKLHDVAGNREVESDDGNRQDPDPDHSLSWDADSKKLALGLGNQVTK